ncbi:MAG TPA: DUF4252 domain-containing protein [Verrucomicrobiae bacterium]|nr:DUF4252 domain-containing protein [Verrucomicrobiae bacterium]
MKKIFACTIGLGFLLLIAALVAQEKSSGFVDFGKLPASTSTGGEFVEVNLGRPVFAISAKLFDKSEPEVAGLLRGLHQLQVNVVGMADDNRSGVQEHIRKLRGDLAGKGWERIVSVKDGKDDVAIFLKTRGEEAVEGLVITVLDGNKEAVFVNIVGNIKPEQVATLGEKMNIEPLKKFGPAKSKNKSKDKSEKAETP